ncbi:hypothetical protein RND71_032895 [Anisodus tanguticus]|uniref:Protein kinase domain-containing protein n=1 Tax=Anisodus tanguticus TaxID=243964 RepID=A0AAE1V0X6_9SOLA|nr:hypothetical protein RND71_032895 [Anisodus tanguticus]
MSCKGTNETGTSASFLYSCNGEKFSCRAFLIFRSLSPYNSVSSISKLLSSDPDEIVHINNISRSDLLDQNQELIVPVNCSCSGQYYQADTSYVIPSKYDTYFLIANNTYQGLSTCNALVHENIYNALDLVPGIGVSLAVLCIILFIVLMHGNENKRCEVLGKEREGKQKLNLPENVLENIVGDQDQMIKVYEFEELEMRTDISKEVKFHAKSNHFNLSSLTGVCKHNQLSYLVFEFMENGSLKEWHYKDDNPEAKGWNCRIRIALDVADGLDYIHNFTAPAYVHNNICSSSILLNRDLRAKISNFSRARSADNEGNASSSIKPVEGRNGYLAPEYLEAGQVAPKIDIYAFGIILLEIITGEGAVFEQDGKEVFLSETVLGTMDKESTIQEIADPRLQVKNPLGYMIEQTDLMLRLVKLCVACLAIEPEKRPSSAEIISSLIKI